MSESAEMETITLEKLPKGPRFVSAASVKRMCKVQGIRFSKEAQEEINARVEHLLLEASDRATANGRKTLRACDL